MNLTFSNCKYLKFRDENPNIKNRNLVFLMSIFGHLMVKYAKFEFKFGIVDIKLGIIEIFR